MKTIRNCVFFTSMILAISIVILTFPTHSEAKTNVFVTVTIGGAIALGVGYIAWSVIFSKRASTVDNNKALVKPLVAEPHAFDDEGDVKEKSLIHIPLISMRF